LSGLRRRAGIKAGRKGEPGNARDNKKNPELTPRVYKIVSSL